MPSIIYEKEFLRLDVPDKISLKGGGKKASILLLKAVLKLNISTEHNLLVKNSYHSSIINSQTYWFLYCTLNTLQDPGEECNKMDILTACSG